MIEPITTPDRRLRVFVSSTLVELAAERAAVARAISALHLTPVLFLATLSAHPSTGQAGTSEPATANSTKIH